MDNVVLKLQQIAPTKRPQTADHQTKPTKSRTFAVRVINLGLLMLLLWLLPHCTTTGLLLYYYY